MSNLFHHKVSFSNTYKVFLKPELGNYTYIFIGRDLSMKKIEEELKNNESNGGIGGLNKVFRENRIVSIGLLKAKNVTAFEREIPLLEKKIDFEKSHFAVLLDYELPARYISAENRPSEESFLISPEKFIQFYNADIDTGLCYHLMLESIDHRNEVEQLLVHQIGHPNPTIGELKNRPESAEVIIPHRGKKEDLDDLKSALWYLEKQSTSANKISVCFDEWVTEHHFKLVDENAGVGFFANFPSGVGPYASRDKLARATVEDVIVFHDSDDVSTADRIAIQTNVLKNENLDAIGSHELRVNKIDKKIEAVRFPIDVIGLEKKEEWHSIFFPTTAIKKSAYLKTGGLSTVRRHSSDSQFYWRAHFFLNIQNVDEFLYIRVKREDSLTTASSTALGSIVRERLRRQWRMDFLKIRNRNISLRESTLLDEYNVADINLISLEEQHRELILSWQEVNEKMIKNSFTNDFKTPDFPDEKDILEERILDYKLVKEPGVAELKKSFSWRIGWAITRVIKKLFGWLPYVKNRL